jgi:murein DD-endopeptidase MepM/ murein hydrolase activator NlpD
VGRFGKGLTLAFFFLSTFCPAQDVQNAVGRDYDTFPVIARLDPQRDDGFKQFIADVQRNRARIHNRNRTRETADSFANSLTVYRYTPLQGEDILSLASRCNIPYSALASLNRINHPSMFEAGRPMLLPTVPGIFVPAEPDSDLERLMAGGRLPTAEADSVALTINNTAGGALIFHFIPGGDFSSTERAFFLHSGFRFPLQNYRMTSDYGMRVNPVTGVYRLHPGVDLAAPAGTEVHAAGNGVVAEVGQDDVYGIYVIIRHNDNWASLYGHLQKAAVTLRTNVRSGSVIGWVGSTGQSTGPHLHFELRQNGRAQNPDKFLFR